MSKHEQFYSALGHGSYRVADAARLLKIAPRNVKRWLHGYTYKEKGELFHSEPLWVPDFVFDDSELELSFRDLIELRFVAAFVNEGLGLKTIRHCLDYARSCVDDVRPFSTRKFQTDGRTIFLESIDENETQLLDLKKKQYAIAEVIRRTFKDLDIEDNAVSRWRPYKGRESIIIDPDHSFGQPTLSNFSVPTIVLYQAVQSEGSIPIVADLYELPVNLVRDAVKFEETLAA